MCASCLVQYSPIEMIGLTAVIGGAALRRSGRAVLTRAGLREPRAEVDRDAEAAAFLLGLGLDPTEHLDLEAPVAAACAPAETHDGADEASARGEAEAELAAPRST